MEKRLKIVLYVLIILLLAIIAFFGIYSKKAGVYENVLPKYLLSSEFTGKRVSYLKLDESTEEKIYDKDGNEVDSIPEGENEEEYKKESVKINPDENLKVENYKKAKKIMEGRFNDLKVEDYTIRLDEKTGEMIVELADNLDTDKLIQGLLYKGDFSMTDSDDGTLLLDKSDIKSSSVVYANAGTGEITVYLSIKFTSDGSKKLNEISKNYLHVHDEESENEEEENIKQVTITIEGSEFLTTYFAEEITSGELTISVGSATDTASLQEYVSNTQVYAMLLNNDEMPVKYIVSTSEYMTNNLIEDIIYIVIGLIGLISSIIIIYMIFKYKVDGLIASWAFIATIAIFLLLIRYTKTTISLRWCFCYGSAYSI